MNENRTPLLAGGERQLRAAYVICVTALLAFLSLTVTITWHAMRAPGWQLFALAGLTLAATIASWNGLRLVHNRRIDLGMSVLIASIAVVLPFTSLLVRGLGFYIGIAQLAGVSLIVALVVSRRPGVALGGLTFVSAFLTVILDLLGSPARQAPPIPQGAIYTILGLILLVFAFVFLRNFRDFSLQTKISLGILFTGGVALGVLSFFAMNRTVNITNTLSERLETSVNLLAEEQLFGTVVEEANGANRIFDSAVSQVAGLSSQLELLQEQKSILGAGTYWDAGARLTRFSDGQYFNNRYSPGSVFVPSTVELDESIIRDLNVMAYLDFSAPFVLENNPQITAVYYTDERGMIVYYPNVLVSASFPHDYDGTAQPTYRVATPLFNPEKKPRWSFPRQDSTGAGLVISVSVPVYFKDEFKGVMTADFKLDRIAEDVNAIRVGASGYAFLVDSDGHIIAMPPQGYEFFDLQPETLEVNQEPQQTIFDGDQPFELQQITRRMVVGGSGIITTNVGGVDYFLAYAPLADRNFSLGVIVPVAELTQPVVVTRNEINTQMQLAVRNAAFILLILLLGAVLVSVALGQIIAAPVLRLTQTANQILEGDLYAQAEVASRDEIGTLAQAFNAMTSRLRETFEGQEKIIEERTAELMNVSESNKRRARQFQSIAQVARAISSTLDLDSLLKKITIAISNEFGFYHVGVFLLDSAKEYAVLGAANSEGGQVMLARGHRLKVGEKGLVGFVAATGRPRVALDTGADAVFFNNPDLPDTRSEVALPLRAGEQVIGVLDVQSVEPNAFTEEDVAILATLADQVSIAIQNARQSDETKKALAESEALSRQFAQARWLDFTNRQNLIGIRHTGAKATLLYAKNAGNGNEPPRGANQPKSKGRGAVLSLPIKLRGQVIGSVEVSAPDNRQWDQDEMDIVSAIIERAAIAMENSRLLAESRKRAAKEQAIGEIAAKISAQSDVDELLKIAARELNRTLPGTEIAIQFRKEDAE